MSNAEMSAAAKEAKKAYNREWRAKNKDKVKAANARYWEKVAERRAKDGKHTA